MLTKSFYGREDHGLTDKLLTELPGILNWAIAGWADLKRSGHFKQPRRRGKRWNNSKTCRAQSARSCASAARSAPSYTVEVEDVFGAWKTWCEAQGRDHPGTEQASAAICAPLCLD